MIWLVFILLTGAAILSVILPLALGRGFKKRDTSDVDFYESQIAEINQECALGRLEPPDAAFLKTEAARRLMRVQADDAIGRDKSKLPSTLAAVVATLFIPIVSLTLYMRLGHSDLPDQPLIARVNAVPGHKDAAAAIAEVESYISKHPNDGNAYEFIAPSYLHERRTKDAVRALGEALRLLGPSAPRLAALGEARVIAADGVVTKEAKQDFEAALLRDANDATSRYYLGLAAAQTAENGRAIEIWSGLLADAPAGVAWAPRLREQLDELRESSTRNLGAVRKVGRQRR